ncbi:MAG: hypothetical protein ABW039_03800 [Sphingobium sp.]
MRIAKILGAVCALGLAGIATGAHAEGLGAEAGYGRADGRWGTELGAGYALGLGGFRLTGGGGVYLRDGDERVFGRVEGTFALPMTARIGAGVRVGPDDADPYATIAMPILPKLAVKGNAGPKYYTIGLTLGY